MLYYDRSDISEEIDLDKSNSSKECMFCHFWIFNHGFKFQDYVCSCHDLKVLCLNKSDITIITVKNVDYGCIIHVISKSEAINLLESAVLKECSYISKILPWFSVYSRHFLFFLFNIYKMIDIMGIYKSLNISIGTVMKNPEMLKFVPDHLKTKEMSNHAVKKLPFLLR